MQVNTEVYGARSTWRRDSDYGFSNSSTVPDDMQFKRGQYNRLIDYVTNGRMSFGQPIDYSICYAAHGENMPLAKQKTWLAKYANGAWVLHKYERNENSGVGWFWGHQTGDWNSQAYQIYNPTSILLDKTETAAVHTDCWVPNGIDANYPNQQSKLVIPIVEFNTKSVYFGIQCRIYRPSTNSQQIKWLSELRSGDWSEWKICSAWGVIYTYATNDATYLGVGATYHHCGICANKELIFKNVDTNETTLPFLKYCQYIAASNSLPVFGWLYSDTPSYENYGGWQAVQRMDITSKIFIDTVPNAVFNYYNHDGWGKAIEGYCTVTAENLEAIRKAAAAYGLFFTEQNPDNLRTNTNRWTNSAMFCGVLDENGVGHGEYTQGTENRDNPVYSMGSSQNSNYNPTTPPTPVDPNTYSNITGFNALTSGATMTKRYVLDAANVEKLGDDLWTICGSLSSTDFEHFDGKLKDEFLTTNPIDSIISLQRFPFEIPHTGSAKAQIKLGKSTVSAEGFTTFNPFNTIVFSGKNIFPRFGDCFLDYEPYTSYEVYVPFCGTTKIRAADILGHTLNITMQIDLFTGSCTAYIMADQLVIETLNGSCGVDQTLSGAQTATMNANIFNGILNQKAADRQETTTLAKMAFPTGWIPTILNPVGGYEKIESAKTQSQIANYEITHVNVPPHKIGSASPLLGWVQEFDARIIIYYPEGNVIDSTIPPSLNDSAIKAFGSVKGFATASPGTASNFHGYTQGTIIADSIPCTQSERERIKQAFESGVFLPWP